MQRVGCKKDWRIVLTDNLTCSVNSAENEHHCHWLRQFVDRHQRDETAYRIDFCSATINNILGGGMAEWLASPDWDREVVG